MSTVSIYNPASYIEVCKDILARCATATSEPERRAALDRFTVQGLHWAIGFCESIEGEQMTEAELKHATRLSMFRGQICPVWKG